jgi:DNA-binding NtrC family response regulator
LSSVTRANGSITTEIRKRLHCPEIVGRSPALAQLLQSASVVAPLEVDVLITGPSGTGKSMLARTIHNNSPRRQGPFVELNCAAIPELLFESILFGAERGPYSLSTGKVTSTVAAAERGTLFLDEVAELSAGAQAKLLQFLETRKYYILGSALALRADVRIISATNANLVERVAARQFRQDLYYRMRGVSLEVPGLDARRDDIPELVEHFVAEACKRHMLSPITVSRHTFAACRDAMWPGHTRQLLHAIEAAVIRAHGAKSSTLLKHYMFPDLVAEREPLTLREATRQFQRRLVREALEKNDWNIAATARELDLARSYLHNLINEFELRRDEGTDEGPDDRDQGPRRRDRSS